MHLQEGDLIVAYQLIASPYPDGHLVVIPVPMMIDTADGVAAMLGSQVTSRGESCPASERRDAHRSAHPPATPLPYPALPSSRATGLPAGDD